MKKLRSSKYDPYRDQIIAMRMQRVSMAEIARRLGFPRSGLGAYIHTRQLPAPEPKRYVFDIKPGKMNWSVNFDWDQLRQIENEATAIGCDTLCEWAVEIIRDHLAGLEAKRATR